MNHLKFFFIIASIYILISEQLFAQNPIINGDFENFDFTHAINNCDYVKSDCSTMKAAPFQACDPNSVGSWGVSHGTPDVYIINGQKAALLWSGRWNSKNNDDNIYGEGLYLDCKQFRKDEIYNLKLSIMTCNMFDYISIDLVNPVCQGYGYNCDFKYQGEITYTVGETYKIPNPSDIQNIWKQENFKSENNWTNININFIPQKDYRILWIHPYSTAAKDYLPILYINDVSLNMCEEYEIYDQVGSNLPIETNRSSYIETKNNVLVKEGQLVIFRAGNNITLNPGFHAEKGSDFRAEIKECGVFTNDQCGIIHYKKNENISKIISDTTYISEYIEIYPNPSSTGIFHVKIFTEQNNISKIIVYNIFGELIFSKDIFTESDIIIDLTNKFKGMYIVRLIGKYCESEKIIKL